MELENMVVSLETAKQLQAAGIDFSGGQFGYRDGKFPEVVNNDFMSYKGKRETPAPTLADIKQRLNETAKKPIPEFKYKIISPVDVVITPPLEMFQLLKIVNPNDRRLFPRKEMQLIELLNLNVFIALMRGDSCISICDRGEDEFVLFRDGENYPPDWRRCIRLAIVLDEIIKTSKILKSIFKTHCMGVVFIEETAQMSIRITLKIRIDDDVLALVSETSSFLIDDYRYPLKEIVKNVMRQFVNESINM